MENEKTEWKAILTHENPDLDAMMGVLLLQRFGSKLYEGIDKVPVMFHSAGKLPDNKTAYELEQEGIIAVDIGGGKYDTHPTEKRDNLHKKKRAATDLVAEHLGILNDKAWGPLIEYTRLQDTQGKSISSSDYVHHLVSMQVILAGLEIMYKTDSAKKMELGIKIIENIPQYILNRKTLSLDWVAMLISLFRRYLKERDITEYDPNPGYDNIWKWYKRMQEAPQKAFSGLPEDDIISIKAIGIGSHIAFEGDEDRVFEVLSLCWDSMLKRELIWADALEEFNQKAVIRKLGKAKVCCIESENGLVIRAARYRRKGDMIIFRNPKSRSTVIMKTQKSPLGRVNLRILAGKIRLAEAIESNLEIDFDNMETWGDGYNWFLHQSGNMLLNGSDKATDFIPSKISTSNLLEILVYHISDEAEPPSEYAQKFGEYQLYQLKQKFVK